MHRMSRRCVGVQIATNAPAVGTVPRWSHIRSGHAAERLRPMRHRTDACQLLGAPNQTDSMKEQLRQIVLTVHRSGMILRALSPLRHIPRACAGCRPARLASLRVIGVTVLLHRLIYRWFAVRDANCATADAMAIPGAADRGSRCLARVRTGVSVAEAPAAIAKTRQFQPRPSRTTWAKTGSACGTTTSSDR